MVDGCGPYTAPELVRRSSEAPLATANSNTLRVPATVTSNVSMGVLLATTSVAACTTCVNPPAGKSKVRTSPATRFTPGAPLSSG